MMQAVNNTSVIEIKEMLEQDRSWDDPDYVLKYYKTEKCKLSIERSSNRFYCELGWSCPWYHQNQDRRRGTNYSQWKTGMGTIACPNVFDAQTNIWLDSSKCPLGNQCPNAHTRVEIQYHKLLYKTIPCRDWETSQSCFRGRFCAFNHVRNQSPGTCSNEQTTLSPAPAAEDQPVEVFSGTSGSDVNHSLCLVSMPAPTSESSEVELLQLNAASFVGPQTEELLTREKEESCSDGDLGTFSKGTETELSTLENSAQGSHDLNNYDKESSASTTLVRDIFQCEQSKLQKPEPEPYRYQNLLTPEIEAAHNHNPNRIFDRPGEAPVDAESGRMRELMRNHNFYFTTQPIGPPIEVPELTLVMLLDMLQH